MNATDMPQAAHNTGGEPTRTHLDDETLAELYRLHGTYLMRAIMRATRGDRCRAEDIVQETLLRAWQHPNSISKGLVESRPWLFTVARRIAVDHYRARAARAQEVSDDSIDDFGTQNDPFDEVLMARDIEVALSQLPDHHRDVLVELHLNDRSVVDAAQLLGVPVGTIKSRHHHALRALRAVLVSRGMAQAA